MVAAAGGSFMQKMGEHISENFAELMMGFNKPFTRIVNQNNTQVTNQIKGDLPTDYVRTNMDLFANGIIIGSGGRFVQALPEGSEGQVLIMKNGKPYWSDFGLVGETTFLQNALVIPGAAEEVSEFRQGLMAGTYLINVTLNVVQTADTGTRATGLFTAFIIYRKAEICSCQAYINGCGQLCITTMLEITDENESVMTYVYCDTVTANKFSVVNTVNNNFTPHTKASRITIVKIS